jgi:hypothetical protein
VGSEAIGHGIACRHFESIDTSILSLANLCNLKDLKTNEGSQARLVQDRVQHRGFPVIKIARETQIWRTIWKPCGAIPWRMPTTKTGIVTLMSRKSRYLELATLHLGVL